MLLQQQAGARPLLLLLRRKSMSASKWLLASISSLERGDSDDDGRLRLWHWIGGVGSKYG